MGLARFDDKSVLVTGAASGIGREASLLFAARGARLFLCDVNEDGLEETAEMARGYGQSVRAHRVDVSSREQMRRYAEEVHQEVVAVDVVINNAGVGAAGGFLDTPLEDWDWVIGINLWGVIYGCHYFVPPMVERRRGGHVVNVSSAAGYFGTRELVAYGTTKAAVFGMSEALRDELAEHHIGVSVICPAFVNTPIVKSARLRGDRVNPAERAEIERFYKRRNFAPSKVAQAILTAVLENRGVVPVSPEAWAAYAMKRAAPELASRVLRRFNPLRLKAERTRDRTSQKRRR